MWFGFFRNYAKRLNFWKILQSNTKNYMQYKGGRNTQNKYWPNQMFNWMFASTGYYVKIESIR
jgi:hypothetical protein